MLVQEVAVVNTHKLSLHKQQQQPTQLHPPLQPQVEQMDTQAVGMHLLLLSTSLNSSTLPAVQPPLLQMLLLSMGQPVV
jgi:hypothetical protein